MSTTTTSGTQLNTTSVSKLFARGVTIGENRVEHWKPEKQLYAPLRWRIPRLAQPLGDLFQEAVEDEWIAAVFGVMAACPQHEFLVLTKRPERMAEWFAHVDDICEKWAAALDPKLPGGKQPPQHLDYCVGGAERMAGMVDGSPTFYRGARLRSWPLDNVMLGTSVEDQATAYERIPHLLACPAAKRFVSAEPLLGPVHLDDLTRKFPDGYGTHHYSALECDADPKDDDWLGATVDLVIAGGESGPGARPMHPDWARSIRDQCEAAGVPFFFKQWGEFAPWTYRHDPDLPSRVEASIGIDNVQLGRRLMPDGGYGPDGEITREQMDDYQKRGVYMVKVGKKLAGRLLDGRTHDG